MLLQGTSSKLLIVDSFGDGIATGAKINTLQLSNCTLGCFANARNLGPMGNSPLL